MIMIQDDPMPTGADKPLRITGDPHKVQVGLGGPVCAADFSVYTQFYTFYAFNLPLEIEKPLFVHRISAAVFVMSKKILFWFCFFVFFLQQARELVVKLIRDKDQGDFRVGRADFGSKMGGNSLDVRHPLLNFILMTLSNDDTILFLFLKKKIKGGKKLF